MLITYFMTYFTKAQIWLKHYKRFVFHGVNAYLRKIMQRTVGINVVGVSFKVA